MPNVDPDFHYQQTKPKPTSIATTAFRGLALICTIGAVAGLIDMLVTIPTSSRLDNSTLLYSIPALVVLSAFLISRTDDKRLTCAGILAFLISSLAHASNYWSAGLNNPDFIDAWLAIVRAGLFAVYGIMLISGFWFLITADRMARSMRIGRLHAQR